MRIVVVDYFYVSDFITNGSALPGGTTLAQKIKLKRSFRVVVFRW